MRALGLTLLLFVALAAQQYAAQPIEFDKSQLVGGDVPKQYRPNYPMEARGRHQTGSGVFILRVSPQTGAVTSIDVQKSTGYQLLDDSVLRACRHWQFKPHTITDVRLPVTFSMSHGGFPRPPLNHSPNRGKVRVVHDDLTNR